MLQMTLPVPVTLIPSRRLSTRRPTPTPPEAEPVLAPREAEEPRAASRSFRTLSDLGLLVTVRVSKWSAQRVDNEAADIVQQHTQGEEGTGTYTKWLVPKKEIEPVLKAARKIYTLQNRKTLPWREGGQRLIPASYLDTWYQEICQLREAFSEQVRQFLGRYPDLVAEARNQLGTLYHAAEYPSVDELRGLFRVTVDVRPVESDPEDLRVSIADEAVARAIEADRRLAHTETLERAHKELVLRVTQIAQDIHARLDDPTTSFRKTLITHNLELLGHLESLNLFGDERLEEARRSLVALLTGPNGQPRDADEFRHDPHLRQATAAKARKTMEEVRSMLNVFGL